MPARLSFHTLARVSMVAVAAGGPLAAGSCDAAHSSAGTPEVIVFNDNGAWSWFEDERAVVDPAAARCWSARSPTPAEPAGRPATATSRSSPTTSRPARRERSVLHPRPASRRPQLGRPLRPTRRPLRGDVLEARHRPPQPVAGHTRSRRRHGVGAGAHVRPRRTGDVLEPVRRRRRRRRLYAFVRSGRARPAPPRLRRPRLDVGTRRPAARRPRAARMSAMPPMAPAASISSPPSSTPTTTPTASTTASSPTAGCCAPTAPSSTPTCSTTSPCRPSGSPRCSPATPIRSGMDDRPAGRRRRPPVRRVLGPHRPRTALLADTATTSPASTAPTGTSIPGPRRHRALPRPAALHRPRRLAPARPGPRVRLHRRPPAHRRRPSISDRDGRQHHELFEGVTPDGGRPGRGPRSPPTRPPTTSARSCRSGTRTTPRCCGSRHLHDLPATTTSTSSASSRRTS